MELMSIFNHSAFGESWKPYVKRCCLKLCDEIISVLNDPELYKKSVTELNDISFWGNVKKEIENI